MNNYEKKVEEFKKDLKILTSKLSKIVLVMNIMEFIILAISIVLELTYGFHIIYVGITLLTITFCNIFNDKSKLIKFKFVCKNVKPYILDGFKNNEIYKKDNLYFCSTWSLETKELTHDNYITISNEYKTNEEYLLILPNKRININKDLYEHLKMGENKAILVLTQEEYDTILESKTCMNLSMVY